MLIRKPFKFENAYIVREWRDSALPEGLRRGGYRANGPFFTAPEREKTHAETA